jgi:hypothetical protein
MLQDRRRGETHPRTACCSDRTTVVERGSDNGFGGDGKTSAMPFDRP